MFQEFLRTSNIKSELLKAESNDDIEKIISTWKQIIKSILNEKYN